MQSEPPVASFWKLASGFVLYLLVVSIPISVVTLLDRQVMEGGIFEYGVTLSGILAYTIITFQFVLIARMPLLEKAFGFPALLRLHKAMAVVATFLVLLHMLLLVLSRGNWDLIFFPLVSWPVQLGRVAAICLIAILAISFGRRWIPVNQADWRWFHSALAWLILFTGFVHSFVMGSSFESLPLVAIWIGLLVVAVSSWVWRHYSFDAV